jgi:SAM-dependent methyltransferase
MTDNTTIWREHTRSGTTPPESYERWFVPAIGHPLAVDLLREAELRPGERVLDVGCGTGVVARLAALEVGDDGAVAGVDVNPGMLAVARATAGEGVPIRWYETGAESMPLPDEAFDVVFCQLSLQFMSDRAAALREMRRVLAPGGRALVSLPRPNPLFDILDDALARHAGEEAASFVRAVFSLNRPDAVEELLRGARLRDVEVREERKALHLPPAGEFLWQYVQSTPLTGLLAPMGDATKTALEQEMVEAWRPWSDDRGMAYEQGMIIGVGRR